MGSEIVCQVIGRSDQVTFIWSEGPASFEPYQLSGQSFIAFRNLANQSREALSVLVKDYLQGTDEDLRRSGFALAKVGFKLYQQIFKPAAGPSQYVAKRARDWLVELYGYNQIESLEIVMDGFGPIPWNVVYDREPKEAEFFSGEEVECWRPFWGLRYNLAGGRRVEPLRRLPWLVNPKLLMVIDPVIHDGLPDEQKLRLEEFVLEHEVRVVVTKETLAYEMEERRPDVMYWLCHASASALVLNGEDVSPGDLLDLFRSQADDDRLGGIAFLNACQTAESSEDGGSFMDALHEVGLSGVIATEQQTVDTFAHPFGLDFLEAFLYEGQPIGQLLHDLRSKGVPLGLLYSTYCPPDLRVMRAEGSSDERKILAASRLPGVALSATASSHPPATKLKEARRATTPRKPISLPESPYRLLAPFERQDRALFVGRDDDIRRFSLILDDHATRLFVLHGESGVGKSSFLRAGVIPYLEDECVGYQFLALRSSKVSEPETRFIRATSDLIGQIARVLCDFCNGGYSFQAHSAAKIKTSKKRKKTKDSEDGPVARLGAFGLAEIDLAPIASNLVGGELRPEIVAAALRADLSLFARMMREISARLPRAPILVIDQAEEVFTLARSEAELENGRLAMAMLRKAMTESGNFKVVISLRTEYYGRFVDRLRSGVREAVGLREYLLTEFRSKGLVEALLRPTSDRTIEGSDEIPYEKYGFRYEDGIAEQIAREVLEGKLAGQDSVLPLIQVIGSQLYEASVRPGAVIGQAELDAIGGVKGGMRRHVDQMVARLFRDRPSDVRSFRKLMTRLYLRQPDGALTTALMPLDDLEVSWSGRTDFGELMAGAVELRLLNVAVFDIDGQDGRPYASLGHDALARVAAAWDEDFRRFERLRKLIMATAASLLLAGIMSALGALALVQKSRADAQRLRAEEATSRAFSYLDRSLTTLDRSLIGVANVDLAEIPKMVPVRTRLLEDAGVGYADLIRQFERGGPETEGAGGWKVRQGMGRAYRSLGDIQRLVGHHEESRQSLERAIKLLGETPPAGGLDNLGELARAYQGMGETRRLLGQIGASEKNFREAIRLNETTHDDRMIGEQTDLAACHYSLAALLAEFTDRYLESRGEYHKAIDLLPAAPESLTTLARYRDNLGRLELAMGRIDQASALFDDSAKILADRFQHEHMIEGQLEFRWQNARVTNNRAVIVRSRQGPDGAAESVRLFESSRKILAQLLAEFPQVEPYRKELALVERNLAAMSLDEGRLWYEKWAGAMKAEEMEKAGSFEKKAIESLGKAVDGYNHAIGYLEPPVLSEGSASTGLREIPPELEWSQFLSKAESQVAKAWQSLGSANLAAIEVDWKPLESLISKLQGTDPSINLPKYHYVLRNAYYKSYGYDNFLLSLFAPNLEPAFVATLKVQARDSLVAAIRHGKLAGDETWLQERANSLADFDRRFAKPH